MTSVDNVISRAISALDCVDFVQISLNVTGFAALSPLWRYNPAAESSEYKKSQWYCRWTQASTNSGQPESGQTQSDGQNGYSRDS
jgi:hypothetical protein